MRHFPIFVIFLNTNDGIITNLTTEELAVNFKKHDVYSSDEVWLEALNRFRNPTVEFSLNYIYTKLATMPTKAFTGRAK